MRKFILIFLFVCVIPFMFADQIQEMKYSLKMQPVPKKIATLNKIASSYWMVNPGSTFVYANKAYQLAKQNNNKNEMACALKNKGVQIAYKPWF